MRFYNIVKYLGGESKINRQRIYVDMDGTLAEFNKEATIDEVAKKGYFASRPPMTNTVEAVKRLISVGYDVHVLTSTFQDDHSAQEKKDWLLKYIPELPQDNVTFVPYGLSKNDAVSPSEDDVLIDDYTDNLLDWNGVGVKLYNGINGTKGRWTGYSVNAKTKAEQLASQLMGIALMELREEAV